MNFLSYEAKCWNQLSRQAKNEYLKQLVENNIVMGTMDWTELDVLQMFSEPNVRMYDEWIVQGIIYRRQILLNQEDIDVLCEAGMLKENVCERMYIFAADDIFYESFKKRMGSIKPWAIVLAGSKK